MSKDSDNQIRSYLKKIAKKGGKTTLKNKGRGHYSKIASHRWDKERSKQKNDRTQHNDSHHRLNR